MTNISYKCWIFIAHFAYYVSYAMWLNCSDHANLWLQNLEKGCIAKVELLVCFTCFPVGQLHNVPIDVYCWKCH